MLKNVLVTSLAAFTLLMSGCGGDSAGESRLETQQMLDNGDFEGVIAKLESSATTDSDYLALGSAYMGKAGFSLSDIVSAFATSTSSEGEAFANYTKTIIGDSPSPTSYSDLDKATVNYTKVIGDACTTSKYLSVSEKDVCLYVGLALTTQAATTIDLLTSDLTSFGTGETDAKLMASACAMQYVVDPAKVDSGCTVIPKSDVTFLESQKTYGRIDILVNGEANDFLLTNNNTSTVLTVGYCPNDDFSLRSDEKKLNYYPCPMNTTINSEDVTTAGALVDTLNNGLDLVENVGPEEMQGDVDEFKCDLLGGYYNGSSCSQSGSITEQVVIDYLNKNN